MMQSRLYNILRAPVISEKANNAFENSNQKCIVFKVLPDATKPEIKAAVESVFNVKVDSVRTLNVLGKKRRTNRGYGVRSNWKKAYVTLVDGQSIDFSNLTDKESN